MRNGETSLQARLALELSDLSGSGAQAATALTLLTRLGYRTGALHETTLFVEFQDVSALIDRFSPENESHDRVNDSGIADKDEQGFWARLDYSF